MLDLIGAEIRLPIKAGYDAVIVAQVRVGVHRLDPLIVVVRFRVLPQFAFQGL